MAPGVAAMVMNVMLALTLLLLAFFSSSPALACIHLFPNDDYSNVYDPNNSFDDKDPQAASIPVAELPSSASLAKRLKDGVLSSLAKSKISSISASVGLTIDHPIQHVDQPSPSPSLAYHPPPAALPSPDASLAEASPALSVEESAPPTDNVSAVNVVDYKGLGVYV